MFAQHRLHLLCILFSLLISPTVLALEFGIELVKKVVIPEEIRESTDKEKLEVSLRMHVLGNNILSQHEDSEIQESIRLYYIYGDDKKVKTIELVSNSADRKVLKVLEQAQEELRDYVENELNNGADDEIFFEIGLPAEIVEEFGTSVVSGKIFSHGVKRRNAGKLGSDEIASNFSMEFVYAEDGKAIAAVFISKSVTLEALHILVDLVSSTSAYIQTDLIKEAREEQKRAKVIKGVELPKPLVAKLSNQEIVDQVSEFLKSREDALMAAKAAIEKLELKLVTDPKNGKVWKIEFIAYADQETSEKYITPLQKALQTFIDTTMTQRSLH